MLFLYLDHFPVTGTGQNDLLPCYELKCALGSATQQHKLKLKVIHGNFDKNIDK